MDIVTSLLEMIDLSHHILNSD